MLLLIRALLLWSLVSLHVVGGAALFRRFFPRESPWFGFLVPSLALVLAMNFIEHFIAVPSLLWLLPFTTLIFIWVLARPRMDWKGFGLPAAIFLGSFAFTLTLRLVMPDITWLRDGIVDLCLMSCFCTGEKVPPTLIWYPPYHLSQYYLLGHYAMSVLTRLFGLDVGTGYNLGSALRSAFELFIAGAAAWRIGRRKTWITVLAVLLAAGAANGATAYLWFTTKDFDPRDSLDLLTGMDTIHDQNPLWKWLTPSPWYFHHELISPGTWSWLGEFHSTSGGEFLALFFAWSMTEVLRRRASDWPWVCLGMIPLLSLVTSTWAVALEGLLLLGTVYWVWHYRLAPRNFRFVFLILGAGAALLMPMLLEFLTTTAVPESKWAVPEERTQWVEFLILWWPVYLPWLALVFTWPRLSPAVKTLLIVLPLAWFGMESYTMASRADWTSKLWGYIYGIGWIVFFPAVCRGGTFLFRGLVCLLVASGFISFAAWTQYTFRSVRAADLFHLEGDGTFRLDPMRGEILHALQPLRGRTILTGKSYWQVGASSVLAALTGNRVYIGWSSFCDEVLIGNTYGGATRREKEVADFYEGKCPLPLLFLRAREIDAVVIYPQDNIDTNVVAGLKRQLAPYYEYTDFGADGVNAGIFIYRPGIAGLPAETARPPLFSSPLFPPLAWPIK